MEYAFSVEVSKSILKLVWRNRGKNNLDKLKKDMGQFKTSRFVIKLEFLRETDVETMMDT